MGVERAMLFDEPLEPPPVYFPLGRGVYELAAGLKPLGTDFGNGAMDGRVFQIDRRVAAVPGEQGGLSGRPGGEVPGPGGPGRGGGGGAGGVVRRAADGGVPGVVRAGRATGWRAG